MNLSKVQDGNGASISFDFDGVINSYESGYTKDILPDPPVRGVREVLVALRAANWKIVVCSARFSEPETYQLVEDYLEQWNIPYDGLQWGKAKAKLYIDDRGFHFTTDAPNWSDFIDRVNKEADEPWVIDLK